MALLPQPIHVFRASPENEVPQCKQTSLRLRGKARRRLFLAAFMAVENLSAVSKAAIL